MEPNLQVFEGLIEALDTKSKINDFVTSFEKVMDIFLAMKAENESDRQVIQLSLRNLQDRMERRLATVKDGYTPSKEELISLIKPLIPKVEDGKTPDVEQIAQNVLSRINLPESKPYILDPYEIRDKLASLPEEDRLEATALKNTRITKEDQKVTRVVSNHGPLYSLIDVNVTGLTTGQALQWNGTQWVPFTPGGGAGFQTPTSGTVDGVNTIFVFATAPDVIVVDGGRAMQQISSDGTVNWTVVGSTITLSIAPNADIFSVA